MLGVHINAHAIKRAYAKNLHNNVADEIKILKILGNSVLSSVIWYLYLNVEEMEGGLREN